MPPDFETPQFNVQDARLDDIDRIMLIQSECGLSPWTREGYEAELKRTDDFTLVAQDKLGETHGFIVGRVVPGAHSPEAEIFNIGVLPQYQARGAGARLLETFIDRCRQRDVSTIWLEARVSNLAAITFYTKHGFARSGVRRQFYSNPPEDAVLMRLRLQNRGN